MLVRTALLWSLLSPLALPLPRIRTNRTNPQTPAPINTLTVWAARGATATRSTTTLNSESQVLTSKAREQSIEIALVIRVTGYSGLVRLDKMGKYYL